MKTNRTRGTLVKRGGVWQAVWVANGVRHRETTGKTSKKDARGKLKELVAPYQGKDEVEAMRRLVSNIEGRQAEVTALEEERTPPVTVAAAWRAFIDDTGRPDSGTRTLADYHRIWNRFAKWQEKRRPKGALRDVSEDDATAYATELTAAVTASTFNKHLNLLTLVLKTMRKPGKIVRNPFEDVRRKRFVVASRREMTIEELRRVCQSAKGELRVLLAVGLYTGLRLGDAVTLRWGEVDLVRGTITRVPHKTARRRPVPVVVPIHRELAAILGETAEDDRRGYVLPGLAAHHDRDQSAVSKAVTAHLTACEVETTRKVDGRKKAAVDVGFHSLRHSFVSLCRGAGAPLAVVEAIVGHGSPAMTRHYTHVGDDAARLAVGLLPDVMKDEDSDEDAPTKELKSQVRRIAGNLTAETLEAVAKELQALPQPDPLEALKAKVAELAGSLKAETLEAVKKELLVLAEPKKKKKKVVAALPAPVVAEVTAAVEAVPGAV